MVTESHLPSAKLSYFQQKTAVWPQCASFWRVLCCSSSVNKPRRLSIYRPSATPSCPVEFPRDRGLTKEQTVWGGLTEERGTSENFYFPSVHLGPRGDRDEKGKEPSGWKYFRKGKWEAIVPSAGKTFVLTRASIGLPWSTRVMLRRRGEQSTIVILVNLRFNPRALTPTVLMNAKFSVGEIRERLPSELQSWNGRFSCFEFVCSNHHWTRVPCTNLLTLKLPSS